MSISRLFAGTAVIAALAVSTTAQAADYEAQLQQLVVSGVVEKWIGGTFTSGDSGDFQPDHTSYLTSGTSGRLSLPLGTNLSIQMDGDYEVSTNAFKSDADDDFAYSFQGGVHFSARDPSMGLIGVFGAVGKGDGDDGGSGGHDFHVVGGEAQLYSGNMTFYVQGGWLDSEADNSTTNQDGLHDALFVRGVGRWFMTPDSRLQGEIAYANGDQDADNEDMDVIQWGVRYDTMLAGLPLVGDSNVFIGYRGLHAENCCDAVDTGKFTDHTIMAGFSYHFGGPTMQEFDRVGATLDLPNFGRWVAAGEQID